MVRPGLVEAHVSLCCSGDCGIFYNWTIGIDPNENRCDCVWVCVGVCATPTENLLLPCYLDGNLVSSAYFDSHDHHWRAIVKLIRNNNTAISIKLHYRCDFTNTCAQFPPQPHPDPTHSTRDTHTPPPFWGCLSLANKEVAKLHYFTTVTVTGRHRVGNSKRSGIPLNFTISPGTTAYRARTRNRRTDEKAKHSPSSSNVPF
uniref:(northern house mosquito) hypothetical protein n=1 Tax=Culex pipiens TaxID=7175 RepID=A0A8D8P2K4_CULPI